MKRILIVSIVILAARPLSASVVADVGGPPASLIVDAVFAASWTQTQPHDNVTITADIRGLTIAGVTVTAWLTTAIGPTATIADQVATAPVTSTTIFSGLDLGPDTYYLVLMFQSQGVTPAGWIDTVAPAITTASDVTIGSSYTGPSFDFPAFGPSAPLTRQSLQWRYDVTASDTPEPGSALLLGCGLVLLGGVFLRRRTPKS